MVLLRKLNSILLVISIVLLCIFLWWHGFLGFTRYFDVDEYAHLHYTSRIAMGKVPYIDYLSFFSPIFHWMLLPSFLIGWGTTLPFVTGRIIVCILFILMCLLAALIFWERRRNVSFAVLAAAILAFLPLPFDKYLEIRPDSLATVFMLTGVLFQLVWMRSKAIKPACRLPAGRQDEAGLSLEAGIAGLCYGLSFLTLTKMLPNVLVGVGVGAAWGYTSFGGDKGNIGDRVRALWKNTAPFVCGLVAPFVIFGLWALTLGNSSLVWYSLAKLPVEANRISRMFIMMPDLFFWPNGIFYGADGWNKGLIINHIAWVIGLVIGIYRLLTPWMISTEKSKVSSVYSELLVAGQFLIQVIFYVQIVPLKHTQYLIPIGVFIGFYVADGLLALWERTRTTYWKYLYVVFFLAGSLMLVNTFYSVQGVKATWGNREALQSLENLYSRIPHQEYVLDLDGRMLYTQDPYYACCIPFGQFEQFLSLPLPSLAETLEETKTKYIVQGELKRVGTLTLKDQEYILSHYTPLDTDGVVLVRK